MCVIQQKVEQSAFTQASFARLTDVHECSFKWFHLPLTSSQPVVIHHTVNWLMRLAMDLVILYDMWK